MKTILEVHGQRLQTEMLKKLKSWPERIEEWQWAILLINLESATVLCIKVFTMKVIQKISRVVGAKKLNDWTPEITSRVMQQATGLISKGRWGIFKKCSNRRSIVAKHALEAPFFSKDAEVQYPTTGGVCSGTQKWLYLNITGWNVKHWTLLCPLTDELKSAIRKKRKGSLSQTIIKQNVKTRPHTAKTTLETIRHLKLELLELLR